MHQCEIMVKDMADSRRVNLLIQQKKLKENQPVGDSKPDAANESFSSTIVSRHFWPPFKGEEVELHENLRGMYDDFSRGYSALKAPRSLEWKTQLGFVELEIEIGGVTREFSVTPSLATVLLHFKDNKTRSVEELCDLMKVESGEEKVVKSYISYWVGHGVIEESTPGHYSQVKVLTTEVEKRSSSAVVVDAGDAENVQKAKEAELAAEMKIYESYIVGMLRNFSTLPVDRIHDMLKMFVSTGEHKYDKKIGDLQLFLNQLCAEEKIETDGVSFSLPKNS
jgi:anaphase-promoting complex subunit 2